MLQKLVVDALALSAAWLYPLLVQQPLLCLYMIDMAEKYVLVWYSQFHTFLTSIYTTSSTHEYSRGKKKTTQQQQSIPRASVDSHARWRTHFRKHCTRTTNAIAAVHLCVLCVCVCCRPISVCTRAHVSNNRKHEKYVQQYPRYRQYSCIQRKRIGNSRAIPTKRKGQPNEIKNQ